MPAEMTKEINKDLDSQFNEKEVNFTLSDIKQSIQIHLTQEKTASETITISSLNSSMNNISLNAFKTTTPRRSYPSQHNSYYNSPLNTYISSSKPTLTSALADRLRRGPDAWNKNSVNRQRSEMSPIPIPNGALSGVKAGHLQCFFCGGFGHTYRNRGCEVFEKNGDCAGAHWKDWRKVTSGYYYSLDALFPSQYSIANQRQQSRRPEVKTIEVTREDEQNLPHVSALNWSSEGFGIPENATVPTEYLFDGGATNAVSSNHSQLMNYLPLPSPIPIKTATNDSDAVIIGKGQLQVTTEAGEVATVEDVYHCPKVTLTIISPGALITKGAQISMDKNNNFKVILKDGKTIHAFHKNRRWFISSHKSCRPLPNSIPSHVCAIHSSDE